MSDFLKNIFGYIPSETKPSLFGWQHWLFIVAIFGATILCCLLFKNKSEKFKEKVLNTTAILVISLYIFDFFVQPFWNDGELAIHKLPFHICTLLGILVPFVNFNKKLGFAKQTITVWAILAPLMFILFPMNYINRPV
ncbi:MAG: YwaF family protein, partial [Clostridia bacterium]|nr:YwaF family protein [Clostridia bacterium]